MLKPVEKPIKFVKNLSTKGKSYPITHVSAVIDDNGESIKSTIDSLKNKSSMTEVTWQELKDKRDAGKLTPGTLYRITDYNCTTTQENTRSAGHQFDIVLLALSENKLAEEGWAMEHPTDVYDVTFSDGVTKKCYLYKRGDSPTGYNIVDINTLLGIDEASLGDEFTIDEETKTANCTEYDSLSLRSDNLPYNYFQNSNLSAWKVWYCLDNDTDRFAWAANILVASASGSYDQTQITNQPMIAIESTDDSIMTYVRTPYLDSQNGCAWCYNGDTSAFSANSSNETFNNEDVLYTPTENPIIGSIITQDAGGETYSYKVIALSVGTGVIYRLIDEWGNDAPYDFKNIIIILKGRREKGYLFSPTDAAVFSDMSLTGIFNDIIVKKTIANNYCQVIDMGVLVALSAECCNIIVASGALSQDSINILTSNQIFRYKVTDK